MKKGFLANDVLFTINKDIFLNHHYNIYIERQGKQDIRGYEVDLVKSNSHIVSTLGEFFEREILINSIPLKENSITSVDMLTGKIFEQVDINKVVFTNKFIDSCGMASHTDSNTAIKNAFFEFFERQSFISNYMYELSSTQINTKSIISKKFNTYHDYALNFVDEIKYFNISLIKEIYVIIAIGTGKNKGIGLGTSLNIEQAINKSQKELLQYFSNSMSKHNNYILEKRIFLSKEKHDLYEKNFDSISSTELEYLYTYLLNTKNIINIDTLVDYTYLTISDLIIIINKLYKMNPFITMVPSFRSINNLKIVKILDSNWFPHMNPNHFEENTIEFTQNIFKDSKYRKKTWIPFP